VCAEFFQEFRFFGVLKHGWPFSTLLRTFVRSSRGTYSRFIGSAMLFVPVIPRGLANSDSVTAQLPWGDVVIIKKHPKRS
jgi:hypothetical protein